MNHDSVFNIFAAMASIRWPWNAQDLAQDDHQARRQHRAARTDPKAVFLVFHVLFIFGWEPVGPKPFFLKLKKWVSKKNKGLDENGSKGGIGYQKTKVLPVKTDNLMQFHPAGPWWWVGVHRRYSTGTVFFIETNNLPIVCVAISFAIARRDGSTTRWHLLTSAHIIPRPHSTEREQYHWACLPWIFILKLAQQWNTQSQATTRCLWLDAEVEVADAYNHRESCSGLRTADEPDNQSWKVFMGVELCG